MAGQACRMHLITLESCHSTWIFDSRQLRFCRILKGIAARQRPVSTEWRRYWDLEIDPHGRTFTVFLDESRTRFIHTSIHTHECVQCRGSRTAELSLGDIRHAVA
jgi:hypothetical protein